MWLYDKLWSRYRQKSSERGSKKAFTFLINKDQKQLGQFVLIPLPTLNMYYPEVQQPFCEHEVTNKRVKDQSGKSLGP